jgi:hypothetical protein
MSLCKPLPRKNAVVVTVQSPQKLSVVPVEATYSMNMPPATNVLRESKTNGKKRMHCQEKEANWVTIKIQHQMRVFPCPAATVLQATPCLVAAVF